MVRLSTSHSTKSSSKPDPCPQTGKARCYCQPKPGTLRTYPSQTGRIRISAEEGTSEWPERVGTSGYAQHLLSLSNPNEATNPSPHNPDARFTASNHTLDPLVCTSALQPGPRVGEQECVGDGRSNTMLSAGYDADDESAIQSLSATDKKRKKKEKGKRRFRVKCLRILPSSKTDVSETETVTAPTSYSAPATDMMRMMRAVDGLCARLERGNRKRG